MTKLVVSNSRQLVAQHIFPVNQLIVGTTWARADGATSLAYLLEVDAATKDVQYRLGASPVPSERDSFDFQCRYCLVVVHPHLAETVDYLGRNYSRIEGKSFLDLHAELVKVFTDYPDNSDTTKGSGRMEDMVREFAQDPFYNLHHVAMRYLDMLGVSYSAATVSGEESL